MLIGVPCAGFSGLAFREKRLQQAQFLQSLLGEGDSLAQGGIQFRFRLYGDGQVRQRRGVGEPHGCARLRL